MKFSVCWRKLIAESKFGFSRTIGSAGVKLCPERSCQGPDASAPAHLLHPGKGALPGGLN